MVRISVLALLLAAPAAASTLTEVSGPGRGSALDPDPSAFVGYGECGSGGSVVGDGCSVVVKDGDSPNPSGRFDPFGGAWIDSQDRGEIVWTIKRAEPFQSVRFALTDAFDQGPSATLGASFFSITVENAGWTIPEREPNGTLHWLELLLDAPTTEAQLAFHTRLNDGWGVRQASVAPIPLPAGGLLLLGGLGLLGGLRRRRG